MGRCRPSSPLCIFLVNRSAAVGSCSRIFCRLIGGAVMLHRTFYMNSWNRECCVFFREYAYISIMQSSCYLSFCCFVTFVYISHLHCNSLKYKIIGVIDVLPIIFRRSLTWCNISLPDKYITDLSGDRSLLRVRDE